MNKEQKPIEKIIRSKHNSLFHCSNVNDRVIPLNEVEKPYFGFLLFGSDYQKFYDFYQSQKVNNTNHK